VGRASTRSGRPPNSLAGSGLAGSGAAAISTSQILIGAGLIIVLAVGSQVLASRLAIPALIVLLPAGFVAGALNPDVDPVRLLGPTFQPLVTLAVSVILYDAGLGLDMSKLGGHSRSVVVRLIIFGVTITWSAVAICGLTLLGMSVQAALMIGVILIVSGPTVVNPLLAYVRPAARLRRVLAWEGSLVDPIGAILGAVVFHAVSASTRQHVDDQARQFFSSFGVGVLGAVAGVALLYLLLRVLRLPGVLGTNVQLAAVVGIAAGCDVVRQDSGLIAAILMGLAVSNLTWFDVPARRPFFETLVQLIIGLLFVSIGATISPDSLEDVLLPAAGLVAVLVFVARPLAALVSTLGSGMRAGERAFIAWMDPRGIVAAATASAFSAPLVAKGVGGASKILPVTFLVIVSTVALYGLTAKPLARRLRVLEAIRARPLLVGGDPWVIDLGRSLRTAGLDVLMWAGHERQRREIARARLDLAPGELLAAAAGEGAELEGITAVYLLTEEDDFNALAATILRGEAGGEDGAAPSVYALAPPSRDHGVVAPFTGGDRLFGHGISRAALDRSYGHGARIDAVPSDGTVPGGYDVLFVVDHDGGLRPATDKATPRPNPGDTLVLLAKDQAW
jgi:NhaP-type Na+/H+ or K+/H+ antiporter